MNLADAMAANRAALDRTTTPDLRRLLPALRQAEREAGAKLGKWINEQSPDSRYTLHMHRSLLYQLRHTIDLVENELASGIATDLTRQSKEVMAASMANLQQMITVGTRQFKSSIQPLRLDVAAVIGGGERWARSRFPVSGRKYGRALADDIKNRLMLGAVKGESVDQLTSRLLQSTGLIKYYKDKGAKAVGDAISGRLFATYRSWADGEVRTQLVDAYGEVSAGGIRQAESEDPGWLKEWDAAADRRVCHVCAGLDKMRVSPDKSFRGGLDHSPAHRRCRCAVVPVRREWVT